jgi:hypothetical protein
MSPQAAQVGSGFFYVMALGHDEQRLWRPYGASQQRAISRKWSFNMTPARLRGGYGSRDCEDTRAYH